MKIEKEKLGRFYLYEGEVYRLIIYCNDPTFEMEKVSNKERIGGSVGSAMAQKFVELVPRDEVDRLVAEAESDADQ